MANSNILHPRDISHHKVSDYMFKKINSIAQDNTNNTQVNKEDVENIKAMQSASSIVEPEEIEKISSFNTNMMVKIEELSSKLQEVQDNFLNNHNNNNKQEIQEKIQKSYQDGLADGKTQAMNDTQNQNEEEKNRFTQSINSITSYVDKAQNTLSSLEVELVRASIDIAKEIIQTQIEENSQMIASSIAKNLLSSLREATTITLKVSVHDYDYIMNEVKDDRIKIEKDLAIAKGGVIILSDVANIDGTIKERFAKIKAAFYEEH